MAIISDNTPNNSREPRKEISAEQLEIDFSIDNPIRPKTFAEYIGQAHLKEALNISLQSAKQRAETLEHILIYGPPGLGKTTLASIIANEMDTKIKITSAPALERPRDVIGILMGLKSGEILFLDEIHRLSKLAEEILYPAMEDFSLDMTTGKGQSAKTLRIPLPKFTLVGATTKAGVLSSPLRDRFGLIHKLEFYTMEELSAVVKRSAKILKIEINDDGADLIAQRSRGTPRIANRLLKRVRDYAVVKSDGIISEKMATEALGMLKIDEFGLDNTDRDLMRIIIEKYDGGPVGIETLSAALGEDSKTIEDVYEPYLLQSGLIQRTPRGRKISPEGFRHMGYKAPQNSDVLQGNLFEG